MIKKKRTLYECAHARVKGQKIYCRQDYALSRDKADCSLDIKSLEAGRSLIMPVCQNCTEFNRIGQPVAEKDRGWRKKTVG